MTVTYVDARAQAFPDEPAAAFTFLDDTHDGLAPWPPAIRRAGRRERHRD